MNNNIISFQIKVSYDISYYYHIMPSSPSDPLDRLFSKMMEDLSSLQNRSMFGEEQRTSDGHHSSHSYLRPLPESGAVRHHMSSGYSYRETPELITVGIDLPGSSKQDLSVQTLPGMACTVELRAQRPLRIISSSSSFNGTQNGNTSSQKASFKERFSFGHNVECEQLKASLSSAGVLKLTVPKRKQQAMTGRTIEISESAVEEHGDM